MYSKKLTEIYKVYINDKGKAKYCPNLNKSLELSLSLLLDSLLPKHTHNRVVDFQYRSIGKGIIIPCR